MNDLIKRAVELADGFSYEPIQGRPKEALIRFAAIAVNTTNTIYTSFILDALAAQLVRQVDAAYFDVRMQSCATTIFKEGKEFWQSSGKGRTMNTIKAIVESGVLDE